MRQLIFGDCPHNWLSTARAARGRNQSFPFETNSFAFHLFLKLMCSTSNGFALLLCVFFFFVTALKINGQRFAGKNACEGPEEAVASHWRAGISWIPVKGS